MENDFREFAEMFKRMDEANLTRREYRLMLKIGREQIVHTAPNRRRLVELTGWDRNDLNATVRGLVRRGLVVVMPYRSAPVHWASLAGGTSRLSTSGEFLLKTRDGQPPTPPKPMRDQDPPNRSDSDHGGPCIPQTPLMNARAFSTARVLREEEDLTPPTPPYAVDNSAPVDNFEADWPAGDQVMVGGEIRGELQRLGFAPHQIAGGSVPSALLAWQRAGLTWATWAQALALAAEALGGERPQSPNYYRWAIREARAGRLTRLQLQAQKETAPPRAETTPPPHTHHGSKAANQTRRPKRETYEQRTANPATATAKVSHHGLDEIDYSKGMWTFDDIDRFIEQTGGTKWDDPIDVWLADRIARFDAGTIDPDEPACYNDYVAQQERLAAEKVAAGGGV